MVTWPENVHLKELRDKTDKTDNTTAIDSMMDQNAIIANNLDIWLKIALKNRPQKNAIAAKSPDTLPETALKVIERSLPNATSVMKLVTLPYNAKVRVF